MWRPGTGEILIVLLLIILLFGPGRLSKAAKELGESISAFKEGLNGKSDKSEKMKASNPKDEHPE